MCFGAENLDVFWSRKIGTVKQSVSALKKILERASNNMRRIPLPSIGAWPIDDTIEMGIALLLLEKSMDPGRTSDKHIQFDLVRNLRRAVSNMCVAIAEMASVP